MISRQFPSCVETAGMSQMSHKGYANSPSLYLVARRQSPSTGLWSRLCSLKHSVRTWVLQTDTNSDHLLRHLLEAKVTWRKFEELFLIELDMGTTWGMVYVVVFDACVRKSICHCPWRDETVRSTRKIIMDFRCIRLQAIRKEEAVIGKHLTKSEQRP